MMQIITALFEKCGDKDFASSAPRTVRDAPREGEEEAHSRFLLLSPRRRLLKNSRVFRIRYFVWSFYSLAVHS